jgi:methionyl-tRNA formyltransferase
MRYVLWANGNRGVRCLDGLVSAGYRPSLVVVHANRGSQWYASVEAEANKLMLPTVAPEDPNGAEHIERLRREDADVFVLAGYGPILRQAVLEIPSQLTINLHAGKLPEYRGSSPMNWALINGETSFTLSVIRVDPGVDTGDVLLDQTFPVSIDDTIVDLHRVANQQFPQLLLQVVEKIRAESLRPRKQDRTEARYLPLRFPDDGFVLWDLLTAEEIHNRIRALRPPYPGAFTFYNGRQVTLVSSKLRAFDYRGEPGRIYRKADEGLLVCARDRCLWIKEAVFTDDSVPLSEAVERYDKLATMQGAALRFYRKGGHSC